MTRTFSDGHPKVLPACNFLSQNYFYNIFLQKSCRFSLQTLTKFEAAKTGSGVGFLRNFWWGIASCENVFFEEKTRDKYVCRGQMISLNAEMVRVANVERGNFVCEHHWHILRTTNNIRPYPLPSHPRAMNPTLIPAKLFLSLRRGGKRMP